MGSFVFITSNHREESLLPVKVLIRNQIENDLEITTRQVAEKVYLLIKFLMSGRNEVHWISNHNMVQLVIAFPSNFSILTNFKPTNPFLLLIEVNQRTLFLVYIHSRKPTDTDTVACCVNTSLSHDCTCIHMHSHNQFISCISHQFTDSFLLTVIRPWHKKNLDLRLFTDNAGKISEENVNSPEYLKTLYELKSGRKLLKWRAFKQENPSFGEEKTKEKHRHCNLQCSCSGYRETNGS